MWNMLWPVLIVVSSNVLYNICQKSTPEDINAFGTLMVSYLVAAIFTGIVFVATVGFHNVGSEMHKLNWTSYVLGVVIVGLEMGYIFLYRAGWKISAGSIVCNIALAVMLVFVGVLMYKEHISVKQVVGMVLCSAGLMMITR